MKMCCICIIVRREVFSICSVLTTNNNSQIPSIFLLKALGRDHPALFIESLFSSETAVLLLFLELVAFESFNCTCHSGPQ